MGFFSSDANAKYGLENLTDPVDRESVKRIRDELSGTDFSRLFTSKKVENLPIFYQRALVEQNWIMIRQIDKLNGQLAELNKKIDKGVASINKNISSSNNNDSGSTSKTENAGLEKDDTIKNRNAFYL